MGLQPSQIADGLFIGFLPHGTGVEDDNVGIFRASGGREAHLRKS